jgi:hypothetical protein
LLVPRLATGGHAMGVDNRRDGDGTRREGGTFLDVARWRRDEVGAASRGTRRGGGRASRVDAEDWRCRRRRGRRKQGRRGCRGWWRRGPRLNRRRGDGRRCAGNRCGHRSRLGPGGRGGRCGGGRWGDRRGAAGRMRSRCRGSLARRERLRGPVARASDGPTRRETRGWAAGRREMRPRRAR